MSLEHSPAREHKGAARSATHDPIAFTIVEFCQAHRVSRSWLYQEWAAGRGPRFMRAGVKKIITGEAAADWRAREVEAASANEVA
jgi:hypothetical protein